MCVGLRPIDARARSREPGWVTWCRQPATQSCCHVTETKRDRSLVFASLDHHTVVVHVGKGSGRKTWIFWAIVAFQLEHPDQLPPSGIDSTVTWLSWIADVPARHRAGTASGDRSPTDARLAVREKSSPSRSGQYGGRVSRATRDSPAPVRSSDRAIRERSSRAAIDPWQRWSSFEDGFNGFGSIRWKDSFCLFQGLF